MLATPSWRRDGALPDTGDVLADDLPGTEAVLQTAREYAQRIIVVAPAGHPDVDDATMVLHALQPPLGHRRRGQGGDGWGSGSFEDPEAWLAGDIG